MFRVTLITLALVLAIPFAPARAEEIRLDEQAIREHYKYAKDILKKPYEDYLSYIERFTADDAELTLENEVIVAGGPRQEQKLTMNKAQFLELTPRETYEQMRSAQVTNNIDFIEIAPDGKSAIVRDNTSSEGMVLPPGAPQKMRFEQKGACADKIILNGNDIQIQRSICKSTIKITP